MYYKNFWLQRSSNVDDGFRISAKWVHIDRKENLQMRAQTLFYPIRSVCVIFVAFFWYRLIGGFFFLHHLVSAKTCPKWKFRVDRHQFFFSKQFSLLEAKNHVKWRQFCFFRLFFPNFSSNLANFYLCSPK